MYVYEEVSAAPLGARSSVSDSDNCGRRGNDSLREQKPV